MGLTIWNCRCSVTRSLYMNQRLVRWGRYKSWTLDSGLDYGLDYGLDSGLDYGLDYGLNFGLDFGPDSIMYQLTLCFGTLQAFPPSSF